MKDDNKLAEASAPEPVVISPGSQDVTAVDPEVKKAVLETPPLDVKPEIEPEVKPEPEMPAQQPPEKVEPQIITPASPTSQPTSIGQQTVSRQPTSTQELGKTAEPKKPKKFMKKSFLLVFIVGFFLIGGGAAAYLTFFQKSPEEIWKSALDNTADGLDKFIEQSSRKANGVKLEGTLELSKPISAEATISGQAVAKNGSGEFLVDFTTNGISIGAKIKAVPNTTDNLDLYFKLNGLDNLGPLLSAYMGEEASMLSYFISGINDQWYVFDDSTLGQLGGETSGISFNTKFTPEELSKAGQAVASVLRDRLLSTEKDKAVFVLDEKIGKEKFENTDTYKYRVKVNKENYKSFVLALKDSLKDTVIEELFLSSTNTESLDDAFDIENMLKEIEESDIETKYAHVWAEVDGKFIRNVRFYPFESGEGSDYIDISLDYQGGDVLPFEIKVVQDNEASSGFASFGLDFNQENTDSRLWFDLDIESDGTKVVGEGSLTVKSSAEEINVEAPEGTKSVSELLSLFFGGADLLNPDSSIDPSLYPAYPSVYDDFEL